MYKELQKQYELLSLEDKNALLIYKSRLHDFINKIDLILYNENIKNEYKNKYEDFKEILNMPENTFIKYSIFNTINLKTYDLFLKSIKIVEKRIFEIRQIKLPLDTKVYRAVTINDLNDINEIALSNLISTSLNIEVTDSFYTYDGQDVLYQINLDKGTPCLIVPYSIKIYDNNNRQILKIEKNDSQNEIILFKDSLDYEITSKHYLEEENLIVTKVDTTYKKNITK